MKTKTEPNVLEWDVVYYDCNSNAIKRFNLLNHREDYIKKLKKVCATKEEFSEKLRREMMHRFWSKSEWELIILIDNDRVWLTPWCGCRNPNQVRIDVTNDATFDWREFAEVHINGQNRHNKAKIDVFDQLDWRWPEFVNYCWYTRLRYERYDPKYER